MGNVIVVTHWLDGDVVPYIRIAKELKRRGHNVKLITHCYFENMAKMAGLEFQAWDTPEEYAELVDLMETNKNDHAFQSKKFAYSLNEFRQKTENLEVRLREYKIVDECCQSPDTVFLCKSRSSVAAYLVAEKKKLPLATVVGYPSEVASMLLYDELEGQNDIGRLNELRGKLDLEPVDSWLQWESSAKMTMVLWPDWYDDSYVQWPTKIEAVGFPLEQGKEAFHRDVPEDLSTWLENNPNPILITGGTTKLIDKEFYTSSIEACRILGQPTILLCKYDEFIPKELPSNIVWYKYIPLDEIMPQISVLIHHGGIGTVTGGLATGTPQMILPCYTDRPYNATLIKELGAGDYLLPGNWQPEKIAEKITALQDKSFVENCRKYILKMQENRGITVAADRVEQMMNNDEYVYSINRNFRKQGKANGECCLPSNENTSEKRSGLTDRQKAMLLLKQKINKNPK